MNSKLRRSGWIAIGLVLLVGTASPALGVWYGSYWVDNSTIQMYVLVSVTNVGTSPATAEIRFLDESGTLLNDGHLGLQAGDTISWSSETGGFSNTINGTEDEQGSLQIESSGIDSELLVNAWQIIQDSTTGTIESMVSLSWTLR